MYNLFEKEIYDKLMSERIIFLDGEINDKSASVIVAKLLYLDSERHEDITIYINSPGGVVSSGLMIYDTIKYIKSDVSIICIGLCASMASIILMSGTKGKRKILPHAKVMLHDISTGFDGKFRDVIVASNEAKKTHDILMNIIVENTNMQKDYIDTNLREDFWLDSRQAINYGIVDKIIN